MPGDKSDMTLTGAFDLSGLTQATLSFQTWYDVEEGWDYAYVTVSGRWRGHLAHLAHQ